jgi:hypothetical protein
MLAPAEAQLDFMFSENVSGGATITGEIKGLTLNATSVPTDIIILTQPSGYAVGPTDLIAAGYTFYGGDDTFTVNSTGTITGGSVGIYLAIPGGYQGYAFNVDAPTLGLNNANGIFQANSSASFTMSNSNALGFAGVTYTAVPEPRQTMALFLLAIFGLFAVRKFRVPPPLDFDARASDVSGEILDLTLN